MIGTFSCRYNVGSWWRLRAFEAISAAPNGEERFKLDAIGELRVILEHEWPCELSMSRH